MPQAKALPRYVKPREICEGDVVKVSWENGGVTHARTGRVDRIRWYGESFVLYTKEGSELWHYVPSTSRAKVTLLAVETPREAQTGLFDMEELEALLK